MCMAVLVRYGQMFGDRKYANDEAVKQLLIDASHLKDLNTGLLYHAYDESGASTWADPKTHHSSEFWCRAMGWYGMAIVDVGFGISPSRSEEHTSELQSHLNLVCRLLLEKKNNNDRHRGLITTAGA